MDKLKGAFYLSLAAGIWGGMYVVSKYVLDYVPPLTLVVFRFIVAVAVLGAIFKVKEYPAVARADLKLMAWLGFIGYTVSISAQFAGTWLSSAHMGAVITSASPAFIVLFGILLLKEKITLAKLLSLLVASAGVAVVIGIGSGDLTQGSLLGNLFLVLAAVSWALYSVLGKIATQKYSSLTVTLYAAIFGVIFTLPLALWEITRLPVTPFANHLVWVGILYLGVVSTAGAFYFWNKGFELMDASSAAVFFFVQPVLGSILGWLVLHEVLENNFFIGGAMILIGVAITSFTPDKHKER
ncbi:DMT family transporter [Desulforamulus aeronauticus]|uniref:EamA domain-containing membrane protein RarD n=1 Tax=Desulforamulus aeronauticus DSM 10349 TaxID=1121421 RepID=A0A1M6SVE7_9FIRM|nr:EamA family transporter [Desulforamulus aeronauticus]SHK48620.1 EamA domain-containing membrane protein RarD [Desulforamulus aeronauticus DSM 10349]